MNKWEDRRESWHKQLDDAREGGEVDFGRVVHSASFRRLQGKTQVLNLGDSDFYRTRLTHSLEVAQIASGIVKHLLNSEADHPARTHLPSNSLIKAIACSHDLGHPPFGHGGEAALNYCMLNSGGFEGNGQTLRILSRLEYFSGDAGANLMRRTLLGVLKYPIPYSTALNPNLKSELLEGPTTLKLIDPEKSKPPKCYLDSEEEVVSWILDPLSSGDRSEFQRYEIRDDKHHKSLHKSLDCSIMEAADDIAYGVHDLEDSIALGLIAESVFRNMVLEKDMNHYLDDLNRRHHGEGGNDRYEAFVRALFSTGRERKRSIGRLVHYFISAMKFEEHEQFAEPLLRFRVTMDRSPRVFLEKLKKLVITNVVKSPRVRHLEFKGQGMVVAVFEALGSDPKRLLPQDALERYEGASSNVRAVCDYVAGMTDTFLLRTYDRLFSPRMGSVFDKL